jgi:dTDP-4-dehydrorhamnose 3,5-epimerase
MKIDIKGIKIFKSNIYKDKRGFFKEAYKKKELKKHRELIFHCTSSSQKNVLRGLHIQTKNPQAKFLTIIKGKIFDVLVDLRQKSKTFKSINQVRLTAGNTFIIPPGVAHGFQSIEESKVLYLSNKSHDPILDQGFDVKSVPIEWPLDFNIQSSRDKSLPTLENFIKGLNLA